MSDLIERAKIAIEMAEHQRRVHERWLKYVAANPDYEKHVGRVGNPEHHRKCIARYDHMIAVIEEFIEKN